MLKKLEASVNMLKRNTTGIKKTNLTFRNEI